jgi:signal peptidase I
MGTPAGERSRLRAFLFPKLTPAYFVRVALVSAAAYLFFAFVLTPFFVRGHSMEPTYRDGAFDFCFKWRYLFSGPGRGDVVGLRLAGERVILLKRVVALGGDTVEFKEGRLFVDGRGVAEPYVRGPCDWSLPPRRVEAGDVYVVGDNRSMPIEGHDFGQTPAGRIIGVPLW